MHSGYPLMAHLDQQANLVNAEHLRSECNWGFYHEVGHNHLWPIRLDKIKNVRVEVRPRSVTEGRLLLTSSIASV